MALTINAMKIAEQYLTEALKQLHAEHALRTMHVDIAIADTDSSRTVGRVNLRRRGEQGTLTMSTQLDECTQGELLLLAGSALDKCRRVAGGRVQAFTPAGVFAARAIEVEPGKYVVFARTRDGAR